MGGKYISRNTIVFANLMHMDTLPMLGPDVLRVAGRFVWFCDKDEKWYSEEKPQDQLYKMSEFFSKVNSHYAKTLYKCFKAQEKIENLLKFYIDGSKKREIKLNNQLKESKSAFRALMQKQRTLQSRLDETQRNPSTTQQKISSPDLSAVSKLKSELDKVRADTECMIKRHTDEMDECKSRHHFHLHEIERANEARCQKLESKLQFVRNEMRSIQESHDSAMERYEQQAKETKNALKLEMVVEVNTFKKDHNEAIKFERLQNSELKHANWELKCTNDSLRQTLEEVLHQKSDKKECVVCWEETSSHVFSCGHCCVCQKCAPNMANECPLCRTVGSCNKLIVS